MNEDNKEVTENGSSTNEETRDVLDNHKIINRVPEPDIKNDIEGSTEEMPHKEGKEKNFIEPNIEVLQEIVIPDSKMPLPDIEIESTSEDGDTEDLSSLLKKDHEVEGNQDVVKPKKKNNRAMIVAIVLLGILAVITTIYFLLNNSKNMFLMAVNKEYGNIVGVVDGKVSTDKYNEIKNSSLVTNGSFNLDIITSEAVLGTPGDGLLKEVSKLDGSYTFGSDYKNKNIAASLVLNYDKKNMVEMNAYGTKKNLYIELKNLFDKYIKMPIEDYDVFFEDPNLKVEDAKLVTKSIKNAFLDSLSSKDFKNETVKTKVGNTVKKTNKASYTITEKNVHRVYETTLKKLKTDKNFIKVIASYANQKEATIKEEINKLIKLYKEEKILQAEEITLSVYTEGLLNNAVKYEIMTLSKNAYKNEETKISYSKDVKDIYIVATQNNKEIFFLKGEKIRDEKSITTIMAGGFKATIDGICKDGKNTYTFLVKDQDETNKIKGILVLDKQKKDQKYIGENTFTLDYEMQGTSMLKIEASNKYESTIGTKVTVPVGTKNNVKVDDLTGDNQNTIMNNLMKNKAFVEFVTNIEKYGN